MKPNKKDNANPVVTMRPDPFLVEAAKSAGINLREILEQAILKEVMRREGKCPYCGHKAKA